MYTGIQTIYSLFDNLMAIATSYLPFIRTQWAWMLINDKHILPSPLRGRLTLICYEDSSASPQNDIFKLLPLYVSVIPNVCEESDEISCGGFF